MVDFNDLSSQIDARKRANQGGSYIAFAIRKLRDNIISTLVGFAVAHQLTNLSAKMLCVW